jgi:hypothetical protein
MRTKPKKVNTTGLPPVKRFRHIARLHTFSFKVGKFHDGTFTSEQSPPSLESGNWNFTFPYLESRIAPVVLKKSLPKIIALRYCSSCP